MTLIDRAILKAARLFVPAGWELLDIAPEVKARNDGNGTGRIVFGFYLRQTGATPEHLRRHENRNR